MTVKWADLQIQGKHNARDLWARIAVRDASGYTGEVPSHGVVLLRLSK